MQENRNNCLVIWQMSGSVSTHQSRAATDKTASIPNPNHTHLQLNLPRVGNLVVMWPGYGKLNCRDGEQSNGQEREVKTCRANVRSKHVCHLQKQPRCQADYDTSQEFLHWSAINTSGHLIKSSRALRFG